MLEHDELLKTFTMFAKRQVGFASSHAMGDTANIEVLGQNHTLGNSHDYKSPGELCPMFDSLKLPQPKKEVKGNAHEEAGLAGLDLGTDSEMSDVERDEPLTAPLERGFRSSSRYALPLWNPWITGRTTYASGLHCTMYVCKDAWETGKRT